MGGGGWVRWAGGWESRRSPLVVVRQGHIVEAATCVNKLHVCPEAVLDQQQEAVLVREVGVGSRQNPCTPNQNRLPSKI